MAETVVKFGTDGWRGIIADDFTCRECSRGLRLQLRIMFWRMRTLPRVFVLRTTRGLVLRSFAKVVAEVVAGAGIPVTMAAGITPTPALSVCGSRAEGGEVE